MDQQLEGVRARLRVGIVGYGAVARVHIRAYRTIASADVVSVADINSERLKEAERDLGIPCYRTLREMLETESLDIICILTPPSSHEELVRLCAAARVHVLCEKPLALSIDSCLRMIADCRTNAVRLCYGASYRYLPVLTRAREMILAGELGDILLLREYAVGGISQARRATLGFAHYPEGGPGGSGMGLCDHGIHLLDAFPWLIDSVTTEVWGRGNVSGAPQRPEFVHLEYANGAIGQLLYEDGTYTTTLPYEGIFGSGGGWGVDGERVNASGDWDPDPGCVHVHGTLGSLRAFYYANALFLRSRDGVRQIHVPYRPMPDNFAMQLEAFAKAILSDGPTPVPGEVGLEAMHTLLRIYATMAESMSPRAELRRAPK
jgi:UDP-N-acetyl-2-amino-2-deoxyglucuronate dehydrogenase